MEDQAPLQWYAPFGAVSVDAQLAQCARDNAELITNVVDCGSDGPGFVNDNHSLGVRVIGQLERARHRARELSAATVQAQYSD